MKVFKIFFIALLLLISINQILITVLKEKPTEKENQLQKDKDLGWDFSNYSKRNFNEIGLRSKLSVQQILEDSRDKIIFLGNSVVAGDHFEVDQVFASLLNTYPTINSKYLVLNAGAEGDEVYREFIKFKRDIVKIKPKVVVWFPNTNDYQEKESIFRNFVETAQAQGTIKENFPGNLIAGYNQLAAKIYSKKENLTNNFLWSEKNAYYTSPLLSPLSQKVEQALREEIFEFKKNLDKNGVIFLVGFLPPQYFCQFHKWDEAKSFVMLKRLLDSLGIRSIVLFDKLSCHEKKIYLDYVHFNEEGHREIAKILSTQLTEVLRNL